MTTWNQKIWRAFHDRKLTRTERDVLFNLESYARASAGGVARPSHATLAGRAKCSVKTVQKALKRAKELGLLTWTAHWVRAAWRALRTSNRYVLQGFRITGTLYRGVKSQKESKAQEAAQEALTAVRRAMEARLLQGRALLMRRQS